MSDLKKIVNNLGKRKNIYESFIFISELKQRRNGAIIVRIKNIKRNMYKECKLSSLKNGSNPFNVKIFIPVDYIKKEVNFLGKKHKNKFKRFVFIKVKLRKGIRYVDVRNIYSKEIKEIKLSYLRKGQNPFSKRSLVSWKPEIKYRVNKMGNLKSKYEKYSFIALIGRTKEYDFLVEIEHKLDKVRVVTRFYCLVVGRNPFNKKNYLSSTYIKKEVDKMGKKFKNKTESFKFIRMERSNETNKRKIFIKNQYGDIKYINFDTLMTGVNPFRTCYKRIEENKINPFIYTIFKKNNINVIKYNNWINGYRPDFVIFFQDKYYIVEIKRDSAKWCPKELKEQYDNYTEVGKNVYKRNFKGVHIVSLEGKYGISLEVFFKEVLNLKYIKY